jgi:uncharacterized membrane protein YoaT (DUF817 family)
MQQTLLRPKPQSSGSQSWIKQLTDFTIKEALSCIFPVSIFAALAVTQVIHIPGVHRYDLMLLICIGVQAAMVITKLETLDELKVISVFHIFGLCLEIFKVHNGCWSYPGAAVSKVFDVPLYSGFLYASVGSYICQAWRRLDLHLINWPAKAYVWWLGCVIYANFFSEHFIPDLRFILMPLVLLVFRKTRIRFTVAGVYRSMPIPLGFLLTGFFVWIAENISTRLHGYQYPNQAHAWSMVHSSKITSWFLLVIISFICVAWLKHYKAKLKNAEDPIEFADVS